MKIRFNHLVALAAFGSSALLSSAADKYWTGASTDNTPGTLWSSTNNIWGATTGTGGTAGGGSSAFVSGDNAFLQGDMATVQLGSAITAGTITLNGYTINMDNNTALTGGGFDLSATDIIGDGTITNSDTTARTVTLAPTVDYFGTLNITRSIVTNSRTNLVVNAASGVTLLASVNGNGSTGTNSNTVTVNSGTLKLNGSNNSATWTVTNVLAGATVDLNAKTWTIGSSVNATNSAGTITNTGATATINTRGQTSGSYLFTSASSTSPINVSTDSNRLVFGGAISNDYFNLTTTGATSNNGNLNAQISLPNATRIGNSTIGSAGSNTGNLYAKNSVELLANNATAGNVTLQGSYTTAAVTVPTAGRVYSAFIVGGNNSMIGNVTFSNSATSGTGGTGAAVGGNHTAYLKLIGTGITVGDVAMNNTWTNGSTTNIQVSNSRIELLGAAATIGNLSNSTTGTAAPSANNTKTIILGNPNAAGSASTLTLNTASGTMPVFTGVITDATLTQNDTNLGTMTLAHSNVASNAVAATLTNGNAIGSLIKTGTGIQSFGGANTYTGGTTVNNGTLVFVKTASKPATGSVTVSGTAALGLGISGAGSFSSSDVDSLWANTLAGVSMNAASLVGIDTSGGDASYSTSQSTRGLVKTGANILTLGGTQTYSGGTTVAGGTLRGDTSSLQGAIAVNSGATLNFDQAGTGTFSGAITGAGAVTKTSAGDVTLDGGIGGTNAVNVTAGSLTIGGTNTSTGAITVTGASLTLSGSNTSSGVTFTTSTVNLNHNSALNGGNLIAGGTANNFFDNTSGSPVTVAGGLTLSGGSPTFTGSNPLTFSGPVAITGAGRTITTTAGTLTLDGAVGQDASSRNFTKAGAGTLVLNATNNTYTGTTIISNGTLLIGGAGSINSTSGITVNTGGTLRYNSSTALTKAVTNNGGSVSGTGNMGIITLGGTGSVDPGNSPGLLTVGATDPGAGLDYNFEFTLRNSALNYSSVQNDVLRLTSATPFASAMDVDNVMSLYLDATTYGGLADGDFLRGGFYADNGDFLTNIKDGAITAYYQDGSGAVNYNGIQYSLLTSGTFSVTTEADANFIAGGYVSQFVYAVPEPNVSALLGGVGTLLLLRRRRGKGVI